MKSLEDMIRRLGIDPSALRTRYREERDRRFARIAKTPSGANAAGDDLAFREAEEATTTREPWVGQVTALIMGGGFGGLSAAVRLRQRGIEDIKIVEYAGDFGGTWYWNRYPGAQCDVESFIYMPFLEETGHVPTKKYADGDEIFAHAQSIGRHFDLYERALFQTEVTGMVWREDKRSWEVTTNRGDRILAQFVITASGPLNRPKLPAISGIERFKGHIFHTARWDYDYTGGDSRGGMEKLRDKKVAVFGTGATGVQCLPFIARDAEKVYVVQRTPSTVGVRNNRPTDNAWFQSLAPGWQAARMANFTTIVAGGKVDIDMVDDGWTDLFANVIAAMPEDFATLSGEQILAYRELVDFVKGEELRQRILATVGDPATAESLKAWYPLFCKRPAFSDDYLPIFNRNNVTLIDTHGQDIDGITEDSIVFDGIAHRVDCLIFATGFETGENYTRRLGFEVSGRGGTHLSAHYSDGLKTLHGFYSHGFPNFFILGISQNAFKPNNVDMLLEQATHVAHMIGYMLDNGYATMEPSAEAETAWVNIIREKSEMQRQFLAQCTPGYFSGEGAIKKGLLVETYAGGPLEFSQLLKDWLDEGSMEGIVFQK